MKRKLILLASFLLIIAGFTSYTPPKVLSPVDDVESRQDSLWVDSVLQGLSVEERIGQLFMVAAYSNKGEVHWQKIAELITQHHIGGLIFFQGGPLRQASQQNYYQALAKVPLLIGMDAEWGLGMRLDSTIQFPRQLMLAAISDRQLIYDMGKEIARQCKRMGIHINFAPVVDINSNPNNPVINDRSFGENKINVTQKSIAYMRGLQENGIIACAKHFPGHGDTENDSHKTLPVIRHNKARLDSLELYPFKKLIDKGIKSIMAAHLFIPAYDKTANTASSLSKNVITDLLKNHLGYEGLVFTDALNMGGVSNYFAPGEIELKALLAGNDILLFPQDVPTAISKIKEAIEQGLISLDKIDSTVRKILFAKYWAGLHDYQPIKIAHLYEDLHPPAAYLVSNMIGK